MSLRSWMPLLLLLASSLGAQAGVITGFNVHATHMSGSIDLVTPADSIVPAGFVVGFPGIPILDLTIDDNGLVEVNPNGQSCSFGCGWGVGADFLITLEPAAPPITSLTIVHNDGSLNSVLTPIDAKTFEWSFGPGNGMRNVNFQTAQLTFDTSAPEPATLGIAGISVVALALFRRRLIG